MKRKVHILTLGCPKNQVDSEFLAAQLAANGYELVNSGDDADVAIINTCGFIDAAKQESIDAILSLTQNKKSGETKKVIVAGCMVERYKKELRDGIPEVDAFYGTRDIGKILSDLGAEYRYDIPGDRILSTPSHYAYLKISEGCDNPCSFCAIPLMRGRHISKDSDIIINEASRLASKGVKELILVGQDTTYYGMDTTGKRELPALLEKLSLIDGIEWIRLMYTYPSRFPEELLDVIKDNEKICKYIDIPIQHISDRVLKSMRRGISGRKLRNLLIKIREKVPGISLRTTLIVGYPEETEKEFRELYEFVSEFKFDRLGVFTYSMEEGTPAAVLGDPVPADEKESRQAAIMELERKIISEKNANLVGKEIKVIVDKRDENNFVGRTEHDAPEIDTEVFIRSNTDVKPGEFVNVKIEDAFEHDLYGEVK
ncbi:MAG: 30S ribosomal protein S12 methylthiotransferase RimO [Candidatus Kryptoniota bacterium]